MLTEWGRRNLKFVLDPIANLFYTLRITPDTITVLGVILSIIVGVLVVRDQLFAAGLVFVLAAGADAVDGTLARQMGLRSTFGAFWDSTLDRVGEAFVITGIGYWSLLMGNHLGVLIAFLALTFSFLVSYTRARAEGLGLICNVGIGTRVERFVIIAGALLLGYPVHGITLIALVTGVTVIQRIYEVWRQTHPRS